MNEGVYVALGARIRIIREALGLNQAEMAQRIGLERVAFTNIEIGRQRIRLDQVEAIAKALGTSPKHLMRGSWW